VARLIGGPLDGAVIAQDDQALDFEFVDVETLMGADGTVSMVTVIHRYVRARPGEDLHHEEGS